MAVDVVVEGKHSMCWKEGEGIDGGLMIHGVKHNYHPRCWHPKTPSLHRPASSRPSLVSASTAVGFLTTMGTPADTRKEKRAQDMSKLKEADKNISLFFLTISVIIIVCLIVWAVPGCASCSPWCAQRRTVDHDSAPTGDGGKGG